jgi:hypothetical protein
MLAVIRAHRLPIFFGALRKTLKLDRHVVSFSM